MERLVNYNERPAAEKLFGALNSFRPSQERVKSMPVTRKAVLGRPLYDDKVENDYFIHDYLYEKETFLEKISGKLTYLSRKVKILKANLIKTPSMRKTMEAFNRAKNADIFKKKEENEQWIKEIILLLNKINQNYPKANEEKVLKLIHLIEKYDGIIDQYLTQKESTEIKQLMHSVYYKLCMQLKKLQNNNYSYQKVKAS